MMDNYGLFDEEGVDVAAAHYGGYVQPYQQHQSQHHMPYEQEVRLFLKNANF